MHTCNEFKKNIIILLTIPITKEKLTYIRYCLRSIDNSTVPHFRVGIRERAQQAIDHPRHLWILTFSEVFFLTPDAFYFRVWLIFYSPFRTTILLPFREISIIINHTICIFSTPSSSSSSISSPAFRFFPMRDEAPFRGESPTRTYWKCICFTRNRPLSESLRITIVAHTTIPILHKVDNANAHPMATLFHNLYISLQSPAQQFSFTLLW